MTNTLIHKTMGEYKKAAPKIGAAFNETYRSTRTQRSIRDIWTWSPSAKRSVSWGL